MEASDSARRYSKMSLPKHRRFLDDLARLAPKHSIQIPVEVDVTVAWRAIKKHKLETGETLSFTAWLIKCIAKAVSDHKEVQAYRKGSKLIIFDDVDVGFTMERGPSSSGGGIMVAGAIVRRANEKSLKQIHDEIRATQAEKTTHGVVVGEKEEARLAGSLTSTPGFTEETGSLA